jgi:glycosyltransferase involved in cell wall biosynthesis
MRILQVIDSLEPRYGGPGELVSQATAELRACGDQVEIAAFRDATAGLGPAVGRYGYSRNGARWLAANVQRFDGVVIHGIWQHSALAAARSSFARGIPYFIYPHGALDHALPRLYPIRHLKKLAYWELFGRAILERSAGVCFASDSEASRATAYRADYHALRTGCGIRPPPARNEPAIEALHARFPGLRDSLVLLFMGRIDPIKGLDILFGAFADFRKQANAKLIIAGEGQAKYVRHLRELATSLGCADSIAWAGILTGEDKWAAFHRADLFVLASQQDSLGVAAVEALATGTPVLVTNRVGICDSVIAYDAGVVCEYDQDAISAGLRRWLSHDAGREDAVGANAIRCYEENFTAVAAVTRLRSALAAGTPATEYGILRSGR